VLALSIFLFVVLMAGWVGLAAIWWFGFRGRGTDDDHR
jgi:hypothetical protein